MVESSAVTSIFSIDPRHMVKILPVSGILRDGHQATCSCEWEGSTRKGPNAHIVAAIEGERHVRSQDAWIKLGELAGQMGRDVAKAATETDAHPT